MPHTNNKEVRQKLIEVYYKDFNNYSDIDVKFEDVYNFLHQELQKALAEKDKECGQAMKDFMAMRHTAAYLKLQNAINEERERFVKIVDDIGYNMAELYESTVDRDMSCYADGSMKTCEEIVKAITHSELDQPK